MTTKVGSLVVLLVSLIWLSVIALAQDTSYSADSLMAAFNKGSQASLKGSEVTVTGVVAEIRKSRVVFKSLANDKVICELVSSIALEGHPVGSSLTVVGKVRGRGMLGNVTLDECNLRSSKTASTEPTVIEPPPAPPVEPIPAVEEITPAPVADEVPTNPVLPATPAEPPKPRRVAVPNQTVATNEIVESNPSTTT